MKKLWLFAGLVATFLGTLSITVNAAKDEGSYDDAIEARQSLMQVYKYYWFTLNQMSKGKIKYDAEIASIAAESLLASVRLDQTHMWPEGSHSENPANRKNTTRPAFWKASPEDVAKADKRMLDSVNEIQKVAGQGHEQLKAAMRKVNSGCKGCHDDYRKKDD